RDGSHNLRDGLGSAGQVRRRQCDDRAFERHFDHDVRAGRCQNRPDHGICGTVSASLHRHGGGGPPAARPSPPPGDPSAAPGTAGCCATVLDPALAGRLGKLVVAFPPSAVPTGTSVAILKDGRQVQSGYGSQSWELLPGNYDVSISGKAIANVSVQ